MKTLSLSKEQMEIFNEYTDIIPKVIDSNVSKAFMKAHMIDRSDIEQHAMIGLIKGIKTYDKSKDTKPSTYYIQSMIWEINKGNRRNSLTSKSVRRFDFAERTSIDANISEEEGLTLADTLVDNDDSYLIDGMSIDKDKLVSAHKKLPEIIEGLLENKTHREIAKDIGLSHTTISRIVRQNEELIKESIVLADGTTL